MAMFQTLAAKMGAVVRDRTEVVDVARQEGNTIVVKTSTGDEFHGGKCIITVGAWASKLVKSVTGADLPVQPVKIAVDVVHFTVAVCDHRDCRPIGL
ncbi:putative sarcosine oxidase [Triticum urartu]|uniref:Putative sarcosine oxidase n=1 Tax=Triticum urartu TaxID=4572 RepID=M7ZBF8_TRIUA|nr:putative sarcosine oxidase [Triticum urartu]